jgi:hypothetical protein
MKLYWRIKKDGKWTWQPAVVHDTKKEHGATLYYVYVEEEE